MYQRILVPVDGSPTSDRGLQEAVRLAGLTGAALRLVHVVDMLTYGTALDLHTVDVAGDMRLAMHEAGARILARCKAQAAGGGTQVDTRLLDGTAGSVADCVLEEARDWGADLIVLGTHGRRGLGRLLIGSDAEQILRTAPVPVLLVRGTSA